MLGPTLFTCYINDLPQRVKSASSALFADDSTLYVVGKSVPELSESLNKAITEVQSWMVDNGLTMNVKKTKCMVISTGSRAALPPLQLFYNDVKIDQVESFNLLGVWINHNLKWSNHVNEIVSKVSHQLRLMCRLAWFLPRRALICFYRSYILPPFDYCSLVWRPCSIHDSVKLQWLQIFAARIILAERHQIICKKCPQ